MRGTEAYGGFEKFEAPAPMAFTRERGTPSRRYRLAAAGALRAGACFAETHYGGGGAPRGRLPRCGRDVPERAFPS